MLTVAWVGGFYWFDRASILQAWIPLSATLFYLVAMYLAAAPTGGTRFLPYLRSAFVVFIVANLIYYSFYFVLFKYIDPGLVEVQAAQLEAEGVLRDIGGRAALQVRLGTTLQSYFFSLLGGFVLAAGTAFILQNR